MPPSNTKRSRPAGRPIPTRDPRTSVPPASVAGDGSGWPVPPTDRPLPSTAPEHDPLWAALDAVADPVCIATGIRDEDGQIRDFRLEYVNLAACRWAGLERGGIVGRLVSEVQPALRPSGLFDAVVGVVEGGEPFVASALDFADIVPGGNRVDGAFDLHVLPYGAGFIGVWRDVSEREQSIDALRRHSELVRAIVDSSPFATMAFDTERRLLFWNRSASGSSAGRPRR